MPRCWTEGVRTTGRSRTTGRRSTPSWSPPTGVPRCRRRTSTGSPWPRSSWGTTPRWRRSANARTPDTWRPASRSGRPAAGSGSASTWRTAVSGPGPPAGVARLRRLADAEQAPDGPVHGMAVLAEAAGKMLAGDPVGALPMFDSGFAAAERTGDTDLLVLGCLGRGRCLEMTGRRAEAVAALDEAMVHATGGDA